MQGQGQGVRKVDSKVCTAKGTRDRRVRLSALTAIQFYDVQDRLGYDRPSKAVDWLITKAKASIDALALHHPPTFLPPPMDSHAIKSFFPMPPQSQFHNYPPHNHLLSTTTSHSHSHSHSHSQSQDLRLSLHSSLHQDHQSLLLDAEMGRLSWNNGGADNSGAFSFTSPLDQFVSQRGPLQSNNNNNNNVRAWMDPNHFPFHSSTGFP